MNTEIDFTNISRELTKSLSKDTKKNQGIYFTPPSIIRKIVENIQNIITPNVSRLKILEPSCGSGEFLVNLFKFEKVFKNSDITGIELNKDVYEKLKTISELKQDNIKLLNSDYINYNTEEKYDIIIGNPPYFVMKKIDVEKKYHKHFEGRPNIFVIFLIKSLEELAINGILSFVLPKSFLNCLYYNKTRWMIFKEYQIMNLESCKNDKFIETKQETFILTLRKNYDISSNESKNMKYILSISNYIIFGEEDNIVVLKDLFSSSKNLNDSGFDVKVGNVVWNQCKEKLTDDDSKTRLIYSSDIVNKELVMKQYSNDSKKNFIKQSGGKSPLLVINRGYGIGNYNFDYCLIPGNFEYLVENHLICIIDKENRNRTELIDTYKKIITSLEDPRTKKFIGIYFGNNAINTTELKYILPFYDI